MPELNMDAFDEKNFDCKKYVKELVNEFVGGPELQQCRASIQKLADRTATELKRHVYDHYMEFVATSKEIKRLESETYLLSHHLAEQRRTLAELRELNMTDEQRLLLADQDSTEKAEELANQRGIAAVAQTLPDFATGELARRTYLHHGDATEIDWDTFKPRRRVRMFLFSDLLIVADEQPDGRHRLAERYDSSRMAVSNVRDRDGCLNVVNMLMPNGSNVYCQFGSGDMKKVWFERFADVVRCNADALSVTKRTASGKKAQAPAPPPANATPAKSPPSAASNKSEATALNSPDSLSSANITASPSTNYGPDWLLTAPEEIQTLIAQRHFDETLQLINESEAYLRTDATFDGAADIAERLKQQKHNLATVLLLELSGSQSRSLSAALRSARRPLRLLADMGKEREACGTLLRVCSTAIRTSQRQARRNNLAISELFFCDVANVAIEFLKAFAQQAACVSTLVVWCNGELQYFASQLIKHYLSKGSHLADVARCVEGVRKPCAQLTDIGLDLSYHMEGLLRNSLEQIIDESRVRLVETIGRTEEVWQPYNLQTTTRLRETLADMDALGVDMKSQVTGETWIKLTASTVHFCRHFLSVTESCGVLAKNETLKLEVEILLKDLFMAQYSVQPNATAAAVDLAFVARNKSYLSDVLLPIAIAKFQNGANARCELLNELLMQVQASTQRVQPTPPVAKPRSVYKTDVI